MQENTGLVIESAGVRALGADGSVHVTVVSGDLNVKGPISASGSVTIGLGAGDVTMAEGTQILTAGGAVTVDANGGILRLAVDTNGGDVALSAASAAVASVIGRQLTVNAGGSATLTTTVELLNVSAIGAVTVQESDSLTIGSVTGGAISITTGNNLAGGSIDGTLNVSVISGGSIDTSTVSSLTNVSLRAVGSVTAKVTAPSLVVTSGETVTLATTVARLDVGANRAVTINETDDLVPNWITGETVVLKAGGSITGGSVNGSANVTVAATGAIDGLSLATPSGATLSSGGSVVATIASKSLLVNSNGSASLTVTTTAPFITAKGDVSLTVNGALAGGTVTGQSNATILAKGPISGFTVAVPGNVTIQGAGDVLATVSGAILKVNGDGAVALLTSISSLNVECLGAVTVQEIDSFTIGTVSGSAISITAGGSISGGNITGKSDISVASKGSVEDVTLSTPANVALRSADDMTGTVTCAVLKLNAGGTIKLVTHAIRIVPPVALGFGSPSEAQKTVPTPPIALGYGAMPADVSNPAIPAAIGFGFIAITSEAHPKAPIAVGFGFLKAVVSQSPTPTSLNKSGENWPILDILPAALVSRPMAGIMDNNTPIPMGVLDVSRISFQENAIDLLSIGYGEPAASVSPFFTAVTVRNL